MPETESSEKFQRWYEENAENFNKSRRDRYKTDPEYRKEVLARNKLYRQQQRAEKREARIEAVLQTGSRSGELKARVRPKWKTVTKVVDGKPLTLFTVGAFAARLQVSVQAIRLWEKQKVIPPAKVRGENGDRLYSLEEIESCRSLLKEQGRLPEERAKRDPKNEPRELQLSDGTKASLPLFTIGALADRVGKTVVTVSQMERKDYLPPTPFRGSSVRRRLYTEKMLEVVQKAFVARELSAAPRAETWAVFRSAVEDGWKKAKMYGGKAKVLN